MFSLLRERQYCSSRSKLQVKYESIVFFYLFYFPFIFQLDNCKFHLSNHDGHDKIKSVSDYFFVICECFMS